MMRFLRNCDGGVAPLMALGAIPVVIGVGAAVDYSRGNAGRTAMQAALDVPAIMAAKQNISWVSSPTTCRATSTPISRVPTSRVQISANSSSSSGGGTTYSLMATGTLQTEFMSLIGVPTIPLSVNSATYTSTDGLGCVLSLHQTATGAVSLQGSASGNLTGGSLYDNSTNSAALSVGARRVCRLYP